MTWRAEPVRVRTPATSANLGPGFDALGLALGLHDEVRARVVPSGLSIEVSGEGGETAGAGERHLVVRAMRAAFDRMGGQPPGLALSCANSIPHGRGLGSSAAAIVAGLLAARALAGDGSSALPPEAVFQLATSLEGHPDNVAACLAGGLTIAWTPRAEAAAPRLARAPVLDAVSAVVCVPETALATEEARRVLPATVPHADAAANAGRSALLVAALTGDLSLLLDATEDFLHQPYRARVMPATAGLVDRLRAAGVPAVISGAGPSVLAFADHGEPTAETVGSIARETGIAWRVIPLDVDRRGATVQLADLDTHPSDSTRQGSPWNQVQGPGAGHAGWSPRGLTGFLATYSPPPRECRGLLWC